MPQRLQASWSNPTPPAVGRFASRAWTTLAVLGGLAVCVAAITYVVLWLAPPKSPRLIVATATYDDNLLVKGNVVDGRSFTELARPGRGRLQADPAPHRLSRGETGRLLEDLARTRNPVVVAVFAAHGGCDTAGPFLIPDDAGPDPNERVRVKAILDAASKLPAATQKLIVFDAAENSSAPAFGQFYNDFARGVRSLDADIAAVPNLLVLVSAGADQHSWVSPEWGESVFLHHLRAGLGGAADANSDKRLSAAEVIAFATRHTREWARDRRGALQVPEVFPSNEADERAFGMSLGVTDGIPSSDPLPADFTPPAKWVQMWDRFKELNTTDPHPATFAPLLWREYVGWVMRADRRLADGGEWGKACEQAERVRQSVLSARELTVSPQTLVLQQALGSPTHDGDFQAVISKVALATVADRAAEWEKAKAAADRLALGRALVLWVSGDPYARLRLAPPVVALVGEGWNVLPAELHLLSMLARDLPAHPDTASVWPVVQRVLRLRLQAEQAATGRQGEVVRPWVTGDVATGDQNRRKAEDLLFANDPADWQRADSSARAAEAGYASASRTGADVRAALAAWQTGIPRLLALGEWIAAGDHPNDLPARMTREELLTDVRRTWADLHTLSTSDPRNLVEIVGERVTRFEALHRAAVSRLLDERPPDEKRADLAAWCRAADNALCVPFVERRVELLVEYRRASRQLHVLADAKPQPLVEPTSDAVRERAFAAARRRGLQHLSAVGRGAFEQAGSSFDRTQFQIDQSSRQADATAELIAAGEQFAAVVRRLPTLISPNDDTLAASDRLARISLVPPATDPAVRLRTLRAEALLNWQDGRTTCDRWSGGEFAKPYYRHAADVLHADACRLADRAPEAPTPTTPFPLIVPDAAQVVVTDEPNPRVRFEVKPADSPADGFVVYRHDSTSLVRATTGTPDAMLLTIPDRTGPPATVPAVERSALVLKGYFRGETVDVRAAVARHPLPHTTAVRKAPDNAVSVAVRPTPDVRAKLATGRGHLHFVLDCSGSMADGGFAAACESLECVLSQVPPGVTLAVSAFGQKTPGVDTPEATFATLREAAEWAGEADTAAVMKQVRGLQPWDKSAVVQAVLKGREQVKEKVGTRAVVLLSDCADNRFTDAEVNPKKVPVKDALRAAFGDGCPLHVIAFPAEKAADGVRAEFQTVTTLQPAGLFVPPDQANKVIDWIRTATAPQVRLQLQSEKQTDDLASGTDTADNWLTPLRPSGAYSLRLKEPDVSQPLDLQAGERLLLGVAFDKSGLRFSRPNYSAEVPAVSRKGAGEWTVAVPRQRLTDARGLELVAVADRASEPSEKPLSPARVADVWFELAPSNGSAAAVRWENTTGWPCLAWDLACPAWPADTTPALTAWWSAKGAFAASGTWSLPSDKPLSALVPATVSTTAGDVSVNGLSVETHGGRKCLVVRISHAAGTTVVPRVTGTPPTSTEVRVYRDANRVTALFSWEDTEEAVKRLRAIEFVNLVDAKKQAVAAGAHADLPPLPLPAPGTPAVTPAPR
jgi:hypothetical protein